MRLSLCAIGLLLLGCDRSKVVAARDAGGAAAVHSEACEAAVRALVRTSRDVAEIVVSRAPDAGVPVEVVLPPTDIFIFWTVTRFEEPSTRRPLAPQFYVDPRNGALKVRHVYGGNVTPLPADHEASATVVRACAAR
jgi:hypothetical protein